MREKKNGNSSLNSETGFMHHTEFATSFPVAGPQRSSRVRLHVLKNVYKFTSDLIACIKYIPSKEWQHRNWSMN